MMTRLSRSVPEILLALLLLLTIGLFGWIATQTLAENREAFLNDTRNAEPIVRADVDAVVIRIKDAASFIANGEEDLLRAKQKGAPHRPQHMSRFGFVRLSDPKAPVALVGDPLPFADVGTATMGKLRDRLLDQIGVVYGVGDAAWPELFDGLSTDDVIMMQAVPIGGSAGDYGIVYAVFNLKALVTDALTRLPHSALVEVNYEVEGSLYEWDITQPVHSFVDGLVDPRFEFVDVQMTRNLTTRVTLRERVDLLAPLFRTAAGFTVLLGLTLVLGIVRRASRRQVQAALDAAQRGNEAKSVFLANMSHEIRTPLNGVLGMAELLGRTEMSNNQRRYVNQIKSSGNTLLALLNDILDLSKLESGQLAIDPVRTRLPYLVADIVQFHAAAAQGKKIDLLLDVDPRLPEYVDVDPVRLRQLVNNLVSNAMKFTKVGEVVLSVNLRALDEATNTATVEFAVRDTGIGIPEDALGKLFRRFTQAEQSTTRNYGGSGLGLSICREICEMMGGGITVTSEFGVGSTFTFTLPMPVREAASLEAPGAPLRVAAVTSSASLRGILSRGLPLRDIEVRFFAATGRAAAEIAPEHEAAPFDFVIVDQGRRLEHARLIRERLRAAEGLGDVPVLVLGAEEENKDYAVFDQAVMKPFDCRMLAFALRSMHARDTGAETAAPTVADTRKRPKFDGLRALLVDDNSVNVMFGTEILEDMGFEVVSTTNGARAVEAVQKVDFDVVFMDCMMPVMDGYEATRAIRALMGAGSVRRVPIVAVTANALRGDREKCLDAGMDAFVTKPLKLHDLEQVLAEHLGRGAGAAAVTVAAAGAAPATVAAVAAAVPAAASVAAGGAVAPAAAASDDPASVTPAPRASDAPASVTPAPAASDALASVALAPASVQTAEPGNSTPADEEQHHAPVAWRLRRKGRAGRSPAPTVPTAATPAPVTAPVASGVSAVAISAPVAAPALTEVSANVAAPTSVVAAAPTVSQASAPATTGAAASAATPVAVAAPAAAIAVSAAPTVVAAKASAVPASGASPVATALGVTPVATEGASAVPTTTAAARTATVAAVHPAVVAAPIRASATTPPAGAQNAGVSAASPAAPAPTVAGAEAPALAAAVAPAPAPVAASAQAVTPATPAAVTPVAAPAHAPARSKVLLVDLEALAQTRASVSRFDVLLKLYRTDTAEYLEAIKLALDLGKVADAVLPSHTIKSSSRILGATGLAYLAENFETRARSAAPNEKELAALLKQMEKIFALTLAGLDKAIADSRAA